MKSTIYPIREALPNRIAIVARPRGEDWLEDEISALADNGIDLLVSMLTEEEADELGLRREAEECNAAKIHFLNLPIPDRSVPSNRTEFLDSVDRLVAMVKEGRSLGVHCRACIGRSSILAAALLARLGWETDRAFTVIESARGCPVPDTEAQRRWVFNNVPVGR